MIRSSPQHDHKPSVKFKRPDKVTLLSTWTFGVSTGEATSFVRCPDSSREQSMSSMTIIDLLVVFTSSCFKVLLSYTYIYEVVHTVKHCELLNLYTRWEM
jgi:hypothetical protein